MRHSPSGHSIRRSWQFILLAIVSFLVALPAWSQNITLRPAVVERAGENVSTVLFRPTDIVTVRWEEALQGLELKIGDVPGHYGLKTIRMRGTLASSFTPEVVGLPVGVYYGVLTNSNEESYTSIQIDASADPDVRYSREFRFAVESTVTPRVITPRNLIAERVPTFEWESVPGATAYVVMVSSSPFTISASGSNIADFEEFNPVWIHLTTETSALYGERTDVNPLIQFSAASLVPGRTYYYTILNAYSTTDPGFMSVVLGPIVSFTLENRNSLARPVLTAPVGNVSLNAPGEVQLRWDPVPGALSYDISVFERLQGDGFNSDQQIYAANTPNTALAIPAREVFRRGSYRWFVIANDREGAASVSEFQSFLVDTPMGGFTFETRSSLDGEELLGVTVRVTSTDGGYTPANPFVNTSSVSFSDSLSVGSYRFIPTKDGYAEANVSVVIETDAVSVVPILMDPLPSRIIGQVVDAVNAPVTNVNVSLTHLGTGDSYETTTNGSGVFSRDLLPGTYTILATKQGYRPAPVISVSVAENQTLTLPEPLIVVDDEVFLSGRVVNQDGIPVPQVRIQAVSDNTSLETVTDGNGLWSLELSQAQWSVSASKEGFLSPLPIEMNLFAGDAFSNVNFVLLQQASRIEGIVQGTRMLPDGNQEVFVLSGAVVTAHPLAGEAVTTTTDSQGRFLLDLGTGSYTVSAYKAGHDPNGKIEVILGANQIYRDVRFQLQEYSSRIFGTVVDAQGRGVEGATVRSSAGIFTTSQAGGSFILPVPASGQTIRASRTGWIGSGAQHVAPAPQGEIQGVRLQLVPNAASISGTVKTARGVLSGITVSARSGIDTWTTVTDASGRYSLSLPGGSWTIAAVSGRYRQVEPLSQTLQAGQTATGLDIAMDPDHVLVTGFVTSDGTARSGARLVYRDIDESTGVPLSLTTLTRSDGSYALYLGALTRFSLGITEAGFVPYDHTFTTGIPNLNIYHDVTLQPSEAVLSGSVISTTGVRLSGVHVQARLGGTVVFTTQTASDGTFQLSLEPGSWEITTEIPGYGAASVPVTLEAGQRLTNLQLTLSSDTGTLVSRVFNPLGGAGVGGAEIDLKGPLERTGFTGVDGVLTMGSLPSGRYDLTIRASGFRTVTREITIEAATSSTETFILIPAQGVVSGRVRQVPGGLPAEGASVRIRGTNIDRLTTTDSEGRYRFDQLPTGGYSIQAQKAGTAPAPSVAVTLTLASPTAQAADVTLTQVNGRITGKLLVAGTSTPVSQARITAVSATGATSAVSTADGSFELIGLATADWEISTSVQGYRSTPVMVSVVSGQTASISIPMRTNNALVMGRIRAMGGSALPFDVSVEIVTIREQLQVFITADGRFTIGNLPLGESAILRTRIQREGYQEIERAITLPATEDALDVGDIAIPLLSAGLAGNAGVSAATLHVTDEENDASIAITTSSSTGDWEIKNLPPGRYIIRPSRPGYTFSPAFRSVEVMVDEVADASFSATSAIGFVRITTLRSIGSPVSGIQVRVSSLDRTIDETFSTDASGQILPPSLPLGKRYRIEPISQGFRYQPEFAEIDLVNAGEALSSFIVSEVNSRMQGRVLDFDGGSINDVRISAVLSATEQIQLTSADGRFDIGPVAPGSWRLIARKTGYNDGETTIQLAENQTASNIELRLESQSITIQGQIFRGGDPASGVRVQLTGPLSDEVRTDANGIYVFSDVPVASSGVSVAQINIERVGRPGLVRSISYSFADVGQTLELEDVHLSAASARVLVTDGLQGLAGQQIRLRGPEGRIISLITDANGSATTSSDLDPGEYTLDLVQSSRLVPSENSRSFSIGTPTSVVNFELLVPWAHIPPPLFRSDQSVVVEAILSGDQPGGVSGGFVQWKTNDSAQELVIPLSTSEDGTRLSGTLPAPGESSFSYRIQLVNLFGAPLFESAELQFTPVVAGRLENIVLLPDPHDSLIRTGEEYSIVLQIRDGIGEDLSPEVIRAGEVNWSATGAGLVIQPQIADGQLGARIRASGDGDHVLRVVIRLGSALHEATSVFKSGSTGIAEVQITAPETRLRNQGGLLRMNLSGRSDDGRRVLLGDAVNWSISPEGVATIDDRGVVRTQEDRYIGPLSVTAFDDVSDLADTVVVAIYADLTGQADRSLTDFAGTEIIIPAAAIPFRAEFGLTKPRQPAPRRYDPGTEGDVGVTAGSDLVRFNLRSERSLLGDTLAVPAILRLSDDPSLRLHEGDRSIGYFDVDDLSWTVLPSWSAGDAVTTDKVVRVGDYSIVTANSGLDVRHLAALPSPFSPLIAPLKVGYFLEVARPPATVTVDILTIRGERIRTLIAGELQWPGRYGSRTSLQEISWDGLTDDGKMARNGRYIIRVSASDRTGTVTRTLPVVLVK